MEAPVARVSSPVRNSRHRDSATVHLLTIVNHLTNEGSSHGGYVVNGSKVAKFLDG